MSPLSVAAISHLTAGRSQIGTSLSFHLFFAVLGVGLPLMMLVAEGMHLRTGDPVCLVSAHQIGAHVLERSGPGPSDRESSPVIVEVGDRLALLGQQSLVVVQTYRVDAHFGAVLEDLDGAR